jgi:hypothetical protein
VATLLPDRDLPVAARCSRQQRAACSAIAIVHEWYRDRQPRVGRTSPKFQPEIPRGQGTGMQS